MRRRSAHAIFGGLALACAALALVQALRLDQTEQMNTGLRAALEAPVDLARPVLPSSDDPVELRLARATALAAAGAHEAAFKAYSSVLRSAGPAADSALSRQALFNLGNLSLRQALAQGGDEALPLVELAKQRYRDLLRVAPEDWDARYNLERALRLAPELEEALAAEDDVPVERRQIMLRGMEPGDLP